MASWRNQYEEPKLSVPEDVTPAGSLTHRCNQLLNVLLSGFLFLVQSTSCCVPFIWRHNTTELIIGCHRLAIQGHMSGEGSAPIFVARSNLLVLAVKFYRNLDERDSFWTDCPCTYSGFTAFLPRVFCQYCSFTARSNPLGYRPCRFLGHLIQKPMFWVLRLIMSLNVTLDGWLTKCVYTRLWTCIIRCAQV